DAPILSQHGGSIPIGFKLKLKTSKGVVYFTLDGSDPRLPGGILSETANKYSNAFPLEMTTLVKARVKYQNEWSALVEAQFIVEESLEKLMITEVMYHPVRGQSEFLELKNTGAEPLKLGGVKIIGGIQFSFPEGSELAPGAFVVLAEKAEDFNAQYPGLILGGVYDGRLSNKSEKIELTDNLSKPFLSLTYSDQPPWPSNADGSGFSLVPRLANTNPKPNDPNNWRASAIIGGSPGRDDDPYNAWLQNHFTMEELSQVHVSGPNADPDNDNMNNLAEYTAGTIPKDINSRLEIRTIQLDETERKLLIQFFATPHRNYQLLQSSKALGPWKALGAPYYTQDGGVAEFTVHLQHELDQAVFFRLKIP
ncbi:MAG: lamin tail domain-containing protein, partial [Verrucomicrobiota bacterium]|nr:lamin tail domain-containing protein [Verrucomicrobiota bacterium]